MVIVEEWTSLTEDVRTVGGRADGRCFDPWGFLSVLCPATLNESIRWNCGGDSYMMMVKVPITHGKKNNNNSPLSGEISRG